MISRIRDDDLRAFMEEEAMMGFAWLSFPSGLIWLSWSLVLVYMHTRLVQLEGQVHRGSTKVTQLRTRDANEWGGTMVYPILDPPFMDGFHSCSDTDRMCWIGVCHQQKIS